MLKVNPTFCRVTQIFRADIEYLKLFLSVRASFNFGPFALYAFIDCVNAVAFSIRPPNAAILMGGPEVEFHEEHPLLAGISQTVPNTDGMDVYDPPVKFGLLGMDQSYVIAGQFALSVEHGDKFKNVIGLPEKDRLRRVAYLERGLEWMETISCSAIEAIYN